ncbi:MAG: hypothetical protein ABIY46_06440 [Gemmatimonadales bacterium]
MMRTFLRRSNSPARALPIGFLLAAVLMSAAATAPPDLRAQAAPARTTSEPELDRVRAALEKYRDPIVAVHDGYFSTLACVDFPVAGGPGRMPYPVGGMGVHFFNGTLIGPDIDPLRPQVLLYEVKGDGLELAGAEWFVPLAVGVKERPLLFGRPFDGPMEGHHPLMPAAMHHYDLHVWLWKKNPAGMFSPTNPDLKCPAKGYALAEVAPRLVPGP